MIKRIATYLFNPFSLIYMKYQWRKHNQTNFTTAGNVFDRKKIEIGDFSYGRINIFDYGEENSGLVIGRFCSIALDVKFILGGNHEYQRLFNYPLRNMLIDSNFRESTSKGIIKIGHDCWIGVGSTILSGVELGNGCVVAAGSIVTKSFPPYSIIGGCPAKFLKFRFSNDIIDVLNANKSLYTTNKSKYLENIELIESEISDLNLQQLFTNLCS